MNRRDFVRTAIGAVALGISGVARAEDASESKRALPTPSQSRLPRWRGFNLLEKFDARYNRRFRQPDFALIEEWGFDFVRLPMSYLCWVDPSDWLKLKEDRLKEVDEAVDLGHKHRIHVNLNLHRAPGYCVNAPKEPLDLWKDAEALDACAFHWAHLAKRYKGIPSTWVSFDLLNEPNAEVKPDDYVRVVTRLVGAIRAEDPDRLVIADGLKWGTEPVPELADLHVGQSTRGYTPSRVSHYQASWIGGSDTWPRPTWPLTIVDHHDDGTESTETWDKSTLRQKQIEPWKRLQAKGVGIHVGEWGCHNRTPHDVALAWMADNLSLWKEAGWGWSLWNLRGSFGVLDSGRSDVDYEPFHGHRLDRRMLDLLLERA